MDPQGFKPKPAPVLPSPAAASAGGPRAPALPAPGPSAGAARRPPPWPRLRRPSLPKPLARKIGPLNVNEPKRKPLRLIWGEGIGVGPLNPPQKDALWGRHFRVEVLCKNEQDHCQVVPFYDTPRVNRIFAVPKMH